VRGRPTCESTEQFNYDPVIYAGSRRTVVATQEEHSASIFQRDNDDGDDDDDDDDDDDVFCLCTYCHIVNCCQQTAPRSGF